MTESVFLTGATGLVGSHVAERLRAHGVRVVALQREGSDTRFLEEIGCEVVLGDIREKPDALAKKMEDAEAVVHAAALVYSGESWPAVRDVNVEGTYNVVAGAGAAEKVRLVVHVSSVAVYGPVVGVAHEDVELEAPLARGDLYARSKREAERVASDTARSGGVTLTTVRPSAVYGERDRLFAPKLARLAGLRRMPLLGNGANRLPVVYAGNVAEGILRTLGGRGEGRVFNLSEDEPVTQRALFEGFAVGLGRNPKFLSIPPWAVRAASDLTSFVNASLPGVKGLSLERVARLGLGDNPYPAERARDELDWTEHIPHDEGLRRTAEWWNRKEGEA